MILLMEDLEKRYRTYSNIKTKIAREVKAGNLIQLKRGVYTDDRSSLPYVFASAIYSPSYISFETALKIYGLISESPSIVYSATKGMNKHKNFVNELCEFSYQDVPSPVYGKGVSYHSESSYTFLLAGREKAVCDTLYKGATFTSRKALKAYMFGELGIDETEFYQLDLPFIVSICPLYKCRSLNTLEALLRAHLGMPKKEKKKKIEREEKSAQDAWDALAAFRSKYSEP